MVDKLKDPDIIEHYREEFETFLQYRDDFREFLMMDQDLLDGMIRLQELVKEDLEPSTPALYKKFLNDSVEGFKMIEDYAAVLSTNVEARAATAAERVLEGIFLLSFLGLSKINTSGLPIGDMIILDEVEKLAIPEPGEAPIPVSAEVPILSEMDPEDVLFQLILTNGFRIEVFPTSVRFYDEDVNINTLTNCYLVGNNAFDTLEGAEALMIKYTKTYVKKVGAYTIRNFNGTTCLMKNINNRIEEPDNKEEEPMAVINVTIPDPVKFLENPVVRAKREVYIEKYGEISAELIIHAQFITSGGPNVSLGRWTLSNSESDNFSLIFRPVKKTRKSLVNKILMCFEELSGLVANTAFQKYLDTLGESTKAGPLSSFIGPYTNPISKVTDSGLPEDILISRKSNQSFKMRYYDTSKADYTTVSFTSVQHRVDDGGCIYIFSDSHATDWKLAKEVGNKIVELSFNATEWEVKQLSESTFKQLVRHYYAPENPEVLSWKVLYKTVLFDEGLYMVPITDDELVGTNNVFPYDLKELQIDLNDTTYFPSMPFQLHELSDLEGNVFLGFCKDNLQNWEKALDYADFSEDLENSDTVEVVIDKRDPIVFTEIYDIGDYTFLFAGDGESEIHVQGKKHMEAYYNLYHTFNITNPYRKGKLGQETMINYTEVRRKSTVSTNVNKILVKPPKRAYSEILF